MSELITGLSHFTSHSILAAGLVVLILVAAFTKQLPRFTAPVLFCLSLAGSWLTTEETSFAYPLFQFYGNAVFFQHFSLTCGFLTCFLLETSRFSYASKKSELYILLLFSLIGMSFLSISSNLLSIFLGLECIALPSYCMAVFGFTGKSAEAGTKYVLYGSATTALMLFGISLLYGLSQSLDLDLLIHATDLQQTMLFEISMLFILCGLLFKIAAFPFHSWISDVYEGAPTPVVAFFSIAPKAMAFSILLKLCPLFATQHLHMILILVSILSMSFGNLLAFSQTNVKRLLAYSSISHAGFLLMGIASGTDFDPAILNYYLCIYLVMNFSAFHLFQVIKRWKGSETIDAFAGLAKSNPYVAVYLLITMISLTGLPPAAGFSAKLFMFSGVYESYKSTNDAGLFTLLIVALVNTVISLFYYLKMPFYAFFRDNGENTELVISIPEKAFILTLNALLLVFFFKPDWVFVLIKSLKLEG